MQRGAVPHGRRHLKPCCGQSACFSGAATPAPFPSAICYLARRDRDINSDIDLFNKCFRHLGKLLIQPWP